MTRIGQISRVALAGTVGCVLVVAMPGQALAQSTYDAGSMVSGISGAAPPSVPDPSAEMGMPRPEAPWQDDPGGDPPAAPSGPSADSAGAEGGADDGMVESPLYPGKKIPAWLAKGSAKSDAKGKTDKPK